MPSKVYFLIAVAAVMFFVIGGLSLLAQYYSRKVILFWLRPAIFKRNSAGGKTAARVVYCLR